MSTPKIKDAELRSVLSALEADLSHAFEAVKPRLLKADDGSQDDKAPPAEASDDSASPPADDASTPPPPAMDAPPASAPPAPPMAPPGGAPPDAAAPAPGQDPAAEASLTPEALQAEYAQLAPEELDMHLQAAMAAKQALAAASAPPTAPGMAPPASPAPAAPDVSAPPALKAEKSASAVAGTPGTHDKANGGQTKVGKSETDGKFEALQATVVVLQSALKKSQDDAAAIAKSNKEDIEAVTKAVTMVLERPERKAVTGMSQIEYVKKSEPAVVAAPKKDFTAAEAKEKLIELIPKLSKSERDLVVKFNVGMAKIDEIAPILEKHLK